MKQEDELNKIVVKDEEVIEALLRDAKRFKSKWELSSNEPKRTKPNTTFLKRTVTKLVKTNDRYSIRQRYNSENNEQHLNGETTSIKNHDKKQRIEAEQDDYNQFRRKLKSSSNSKYRSPHKSPNRNRRKYTE